MTRLTSPGSTLLSFNRGAVAANGGRRASRKSAVRAYAGVILIFFVLILQTIPQAAPAGAQTTDGETTVYVVPIRGTIEPGIGHFLERSLQDADDAGAAIVILDIETPGGRLDTVLQMRDAILDSPVPVVAFVNREAFSAGALITIASDEIWMAPGAVFGAATPIDGATGETSSEKTISAVRSTFRATAEETGRDPDIAAAMVDPAVTVDGLDDATSLLTLTVGQAEEWGYTNGVAADLPALIDQLGFAGARVEQVSMSPAEHLVRWITSPVVSSLLILVGLFLIVADALFAGFGLAAVAGVACLGLFFWGYALAGLAGWEDVVLVGLGLVLIALEIFVIPGFGVAGVLGLVSLASGLVLAMSNRGFRNFEVTDDVIRAGWTVAVSLVLVMAGLIVSMLVIPRSSKPANRFGGLALAATVDSSGRPELEGRPHPRGWLLHRFGGHDVLEAGDLHMPDAPGKPVPKVRE
jgi:membrane-bound serine protease (ClpP class)